MQFLKSKKSQEYFSGTFLPYKHIKTKNLRLAKVNPHAEIYDHIGKTEEIKRNKLEEIVPIVS